MITVFLPPDEEPVTVVEALAHCRLDAANLEDGYEVAMGVWITAARTIAEQELRRYLITQTLDRYLDDFPRFKAHRIERHLADSYSDVILLPPIQSVEAITYLDTAGIEQPLDASQYIVDAKGEHARIIPAYATTWPSTREQANAVKVRFVAGYGAAEDVPACIKAWILLKVAEMHPSVKQPMPEYAGGLLDPERVYGRIQ